jgi:hypothetical protein
MASFVYQYGRNNCAYYPTYWTNPATVFGWFVDASYNVSDGATTIDWAGLQALNSGYTGETVSATITGRSYSQAVDPLDADYTRSTFKVSGLGVGAASASFVPAYLIVADVTGNLFACFDLLEGVSQLSTYSGSEDFGVCWPDGLAWHASYYTATPFSTFLYTSGAYPANTAPSGGTSVYEASYNVSVLWDGTDGSVLYRLVPADYRLPNRFALSSSSTYIDALNYAFSGTTAISDGTGTRTTVGSNPAEYRTTTITIPSANIASAFTCAKVLVYSYFATQLVAAIDVPDTAIATGSDARLEYAGTKVLSFTNYSDAAAFAPAPAQGGPSTVEPDYLQLRDAITGLLQPEPSFRVLGLVALWTPYTYTGAPAELLHNTGEIVAEIPAVEAALVGGPSPYVVAELNKLRADMRAEMLPIFSAEVEAKLPLASAALAATTNAIGANLPVLRSALTAASGTAAVVSARLTTTSASLTSQAGGLVSISASIPRPTADIRTVTGVGATIAGRITRVRSSLTGWVVNQASIASELPSYRAVLAGVSGVNAVITPALTRLEASLEDAPISGTTFVATYVVNTRSFAVTEYGNYDFTSYTRLTDGVYMSGPDGVSKIDGTQDVLLIDTGDQIDTTTAPIPCSWTTGNVDFGSVQQKRVTDIYSSVTGDGDIAVTVSADKGDPYEYRSADFDAASNKERQIQVGKGLKGRFWTFTFAKDAPFVHNDSHVAVVDLSRRV